MEERSSEPGKGAMAMSLSALAVYGVFFAVLAVAAYLVRSKRAYFYVLTVLSTSVAFLTYRIAALSCSDFWSPTGCTYNISGIAGLWLALVFLVCMVAGHDFRGRKERAGRRCRDGDERPGCSIDKH